MKSIFFAITSLLKHIVTLYNPSPKRFQNILAHINKRMRDNATLKSLKLGLDHKTLKIIGHQLPSETLFFGGNVTVRYVVILSQYIVYFIFNSFHFISYHSVNNGKWKANYNHGFRQFMHCNDLINWVVIYSDEITQQDIDRFIQRLREIGRRMGFNVNEPRLKETIADEYMATLLCGDYSQTQLFCFFKEEKDYIYSAMERKCCNFLGVPSTMIRNQIFVDNLPDPHIASIAHSMQIRIGNFFLFSHFNSNRKTFNHIQ